MRPTFEIELEKNSRKQMNKLARKFLPLLDKSPDLLEDMLFTDKTPANTKLGIIRLMLDIIEKARKLDAEHELKIKSSEGDLKSQAKKLVKDNPELEDEFDDVPQIVVGNVTKITG